MRRKLVLLGFLTAVAGCAGSPPPEPIVRTVEVRVPVTLPCVPKALRVRPEYADNDKALTAAVDPAERYLLLWVGRLQRMDREMELEAAVAGCPREE